MIIPLFQSVLIRNVESTNLGNMNCGTLLQVVRSTNVRKSIRIVIKLLQFSATTCEY